MATTLEELTSELCETHRLRGQILQAVSMQKAYDTWRQNNMPETGPDHAQLHLVFQWGIQYAIDALAEKMDAQGYVVGDGSESLEGDVSNTIDNVFRKAGFEHPDGDVMCVADIKMKMDI